MLLLLLNMIAKNVSWYLYKFLDVSSVSITSESFIDNVLVVVGLDYSYKKMKYKIPDNACVY
jgi:hypothetical protein